MSGCKFIDQSNIIQRKFQIKIQLTSMYQASELLIHPHRLNIIQGKFQIIFS